MDARDARPSRRTALRALSATACATAVLALLRCTPRRPDPARTAAHLARFDAALRCDDDSALYPAERIRRTSNEYIDRSARPPEHCFNCQYYVPPSARGLCATCAIVPGPVHPAAWCKLWLYDPRREPR